jgi:hypothetical protein
VIDCRAPETREQITLRVAVSGYSSSQHVDDGIGSAIVCVVVGFGSMVLHSTFTHISPQASSASSSVGM